jgi:Zn-dependent protease
MRGDVKLFKLFGVEVRLHASWWFIVILLAWILSTGFFPQFYPQNTVAFYWAAGMAAALFLFISVLIHEFSHSLVAMFHGMKVESITLFFFGGVAGITDEDIQPWHEFTMAIAGPLMSFALAGLFYLVFFLTHSAASTTMMFLNAISFYLYQLNFILAVFNMIPGYPLDGGRAFRAMLHAHYKDLKKATLLASKGGKAFAIVLIILGVLQIIVGSLGGLWLIFLGVFLHFIANLSYQQVVFKEVLGKWAAKKFLTKDYQIVNANTNLKQFLNKHLGDRDTAFLVKSKSKISGMTEMHKLSAMKPEVISLMTVGQVTQPLSQLDSINENESGFTAFQKLAKADSNFLPVKNSANKITGVVRKENLMNALVWNLKFQANFTNTKETISKKKTTKKSTKKTRSKSKAKKTKNSKK